MATQLRPTTRALLPDNEKTTTTAGGKEEAGLERKAKAPLLPRFPNYSQLSTLTHSLAPCLSARRVRPYRGRSSPRPSVSRSVQTDALRETGVDRPSDAGGFSERRASGTLPAATKRWEGGGGAPNGLRYVRALFQESGRRGLARSFAEEPN